MQSRYDDPAYQKQVSLQMLATPTFEIACRAITDLRAERKHDATYIDDLLKRIQELEKSLEGANKAFNDAASLWQNATHDFREQVKDLETKLAQFQADSIELNIAKRALLNIFTSGKIFPNEGETK